MDLTDQQLLRRYVQERSEAAFTEVVRRHLDLVYSVALRLTAGETGLAEDVTQKVFADLAQKAARAAGCASLAGWLHTHARFVALTAIRGESRRRAREQEALAMNEPTTPEELNWEQLRPLLDEAIGQLRPADRDAVIMRFFENKSHDEVGAALGLPENTARMRIERALEKLRARFERQGITASAAAIAATLAANSVHAAPVGMAVKVASVSFAAAGTGLAGTFWNTLFMSTKTKIALTVVIVAGVAAIPLEVQRRQINQLREQLGQGMRPPAASVKSAAGVAGAQSNLARILALPNRLARMRELIDYASSLDAASARSLLENLGRQPANEENRMAMGILMERLVQIDPEGTLAWAKTLPGSWAREQIFTLLFNSWSGVDAVAAFKAIEHVENIAVRSDLQRIALANMAKVDPKGALEMLHHLPASQQSSMLFDAVFTTWANTDPSAASAAVLELPATRNRVFGIESVLQGWAQTDPLGALAWAGNLTGGVRSTALNTALGNLARQDPEAAISYIGNVTNATTRNDLIGVLAQSWGQNDPQAALAWVDENATGQAHDAAMRSIVGRLSQVDPQSAVAYLEQIPDGNLRDQSIAQIAYNWAQVDTTAALAWTQSLPSITTNPADPRKTVLVNLINNMASSDPSAAADYVQTMQGDPYFGRLIAQVAANWMSADPKAAMAWAQTLSPETGGNDAVSQVITQLTTTDPQGAWTYAQQLPEGPTRVQTLGNVITKWSAQDPAKAAALLGELPAGQALTAATLTVGQNWIKQDPLAASQWINTLPAGNQRDQAVSMLITMEGKNDLPTAFSWATSLDGDTARQGQLSTVVKQWAQKDPAGAAAALQTNAKLTDQERAELLKLIPNPSAASANR